MSGFIGFAMRRTWGNKRIGPHNHDIMEVLVGSMLGDGNLECGSNKSGKLAEFISATGPNASYALWLNSFFYEHGYTANSQPRSYIHTANDNREYYQIRIAKFIGYPPLGNNQINPSGLPDYFCFMNLGILKEID